MSELRQRIETVTRKAGLLTSRNEMLRRDRAALSERLAELEAETSRQRQQIEELQMRLDYLTMVAVVEPSAKEREAVRERLSRLVHDIDQCIADLSDCNER